MTPMEELREQAAKIADACEEKAGISIGSGHCIRAMPLPAPVALPQAGKVAYGVGSQYSAVALLIQTFERWLEIGPNAQPHYPGGNRPWSTGDLKWMIEQLSALSHTPTETPTAAAPDDGLMGRVKAALEPFAKAPTAVQKGLRTP